jgi:uncharacterized protein
MSIAADRAVDPRSRQVAIGALVVGAALLGITLGVRQGSAAFYAAGFALAGTWAAAYALAPSGLRSGHRRLFDSVVGLCVGSLMFGVFIVGAWVIRRFDLLGDAVAELLQAADSSAMVWVLTLAGVNAVAEELFFRGTLIDAVHRRFALAAGVIPYVLTTVPSGNIALIIAAAVMGAVFTVLRLRTGALTASIATHLSWSALMIILFPR